MTEPQGPVYLTLPREVLAHEIESFEYDEKPRMMANVYGPSTDAVKAAARILAQAKHPIVVVGALGRDPEAIAPFIRLCETLNIGVFSGGGWINFPSNHRLHQVSPAAAQFEKADVVLCIESDVPWSPSSGREPREDAKVIAIGSDPLFSDYPVRGFRMDVSLAGSPRQSIIALNEAVAGEKLDTAAIAERGAAWGAAHDSGRAKLKADAEAVKDKRPLDKAWVTYCLEQLRDEDTIIVNELGLDINQFELSKTGQFYGVSTAGVLGWGIGAALGVKLAARDKTVISCVGDGSYMFGVPSAAHWVSRKMNLPVLYIVWNNSQWGAVANATRGVYPDGWSAKTNSYPFSDLSPSLDFEMECQAAGGYGERVEDPAEVPAAIERALHAVRVEKRQALLNIVGA